MQKRLATLTRHQNTIIAILIIALTFITQNNSLAQYYKSNLVYNDADFDATSSWSGSTKPNINGNIDNTLNIINGASIKKTGNIKIVAGSIILDGKLTITGNYSETGPWNPIAINQYGELIVGGTFTTGVGTTIAGKITVNGISTFNGALTLNNTATATFLNTLTSSNTNIYGTLNVTGTTKFTNTSTINAGATVTINGSFESPGITQDGALTISGNSTFTNGVTTGVNATTYIGGTFSAPKLEAFTNVTIKSTATISTTLTVKTGATVEIFGDLNAQGATVTVEQGGNLIVHGNLNVKTGNFNVYGNAVASGNLDVSNLAVSSTGNLIIGGSLFKTTGGGNSTPEGNGSVYILNPDAKITVPGYSQISAGSYGDVNDFIANESGTSLATIVSDLGLTSMVTWYSIDKNINSNGLWNDTEMWTLDASIKTLNTTTTAGKPITPGIADNYVVKTGKTITIPSSVSITTSKITIEANATLNLAAGGKLTTNDIVTNNGTFNLEFTTSQPCSYINKKAITGNNVTLKRTFEGSRAWYIGNCIADVAYSTFANATPTPTPAANVSLMYSYNTSSKTWVPASGSDQLGLMKGYSINFGKGGPYTVTQSGAIATGNQTTTISADGDKWNLLSNPFPAYVDFSTSKIGEWNISNIEPSLYVRTRTSAGTSTYYTVNLTTGLSTPSGLTYLAPMQAFYVKATAAGNFGINSTARINPTSAPTLKAAQTESDVLRLNTSNASSSDETVIVFRTIGNENISLIDSEKRLETAGLTPQIFSKKDGKNIAINVMPEDPTSYTIPLAMTVGAKGAGAITISASSITEFMPAVNVYLKDLSTGTITDLRQSPSYTFTSEAVSAANRFELFFQKAPNTATGTDVNQATETFSIKAFAIGNQAIVTIADDTYSGSAIIELYDASGKLITKQTSATKRTEIEMTGNTQMVIVKVTYKNQSKSFKIMKSLGL